MNNVPKHIAIIMDGNRRWARERGLPPLAGHRYVVDKILEPLVEYASTKGIKYLTFWAWSTENWDRDKKEVEGIMTIFRNVMKRKLERLHKNGVRIRVVGDISPFASDIQHILLDAVEKTKNNTKITTVFALNYGGRDEIIRAIRKLRDRSRVNQKTFENYLDTDGMPDPELIVRTGGEQRLSGFLLWQSQYSELYFPTWFMPEFTEEKLDEVLMEFAKRQRRFGK